MKLLNLLGTALATLGAVLVFVGLSGEGSFLLPGLALLLLGLLARVTRREGEAR